MIQSGTPMAVAVVRLLLMCAWDVASNKDRITSFYDQ
jgi:hypothetical protein